MDSKSLLELEIESLGVPKSILAGKCKVSRPTLDKWIKNPELMTCEAVMTLSEALRISDTDKLLAIFFPRFVQNNVSVSE